MVHVLQEVSHSQSVYTTQGTIDPQINPSPINCLPEELLQVIISFSVEEETNPQRRYYTLSHVNRFWRQVIVKNASFWTSIDLSWLPEVVDTILERAGSTSMLSFRFIRHNPLIAKEAETIRIRNILTLHPRRVETLHVDLESPIVQRCSGVLFPYLKNAVFRCGPHDLDHKYQIPFLATTSRLQSLDISNCHVDLPWDLLSGVFCCIRQLKIRFNTRAGYTHFLVNTPSFVNLQDLWVECLYGIDEDPELQTRSSSPARYPIHSFTLSNLRTLHVSSFNMPTIMMRLHTPNLQRYEVCTRKHGSSHAFRSHLHPIFEDLDYSSIRSLYVGFHPCCSAICVVGSELEDLNVERYTSNFPSPHLESDYEANTGPKKFHIRLFHSPTARVFLSKILNLLLPKLPNLLYLSLRLHEFRELDPSFEIFSPALAVIFERAMIKHLHLYADKRYTVMVFAALGFADRCPNLESILCRFRYGLPLEVFRTSTSSLFRYLKTRFEGGNRCLRFVCLENYPADEGMRKQAKDLGISITFAEPSPICQDLQ